MTLISGEEAILSQLHTTKRTATFRDPNVISEITSKQNKTKQNHKQQKQRTNLKLSTATWHITRKDGNEMCEIKMAS